MKLRKRLGRGGDGENLVLRTIGVHAESLLRTARRYSICSDDAQDAYQRALVIFMEHAERLDAEHAVRWLHVVVKREALAVRRTRRRELGVVEVDVDNHVADRLPSADDRVATFDLIGRSAEALQRLKPQELRALWLRAQGHSYAEISAITGWSYTKVNRSMTEGRRSFLRHYASIESGAECKRWLPVISALVDGEATPEQLEELRPHLRRCAGCRGSLRTLKESAKPLSAVLPVPFAVLELDGGDHTAGFVMRVYEFVATGIHDRAAGSMVKAQTAIEAASAGKAAAIASATVAVAGGGYATVDHSGQARTLPTRTTSSTLPKSSHRRPPVPQQRTVLPARFVQKPSADRVARVTEFEPAESKANPDAPEFRRQARSAATTPTNSAPERTAASRRLTKPVTPESAPEFRASRAAPEFAP